MDRSRIEKIAQTPEDKLLLARVWDKLNGGMTRCIPASTDFLSLREQALCQYLFGQQEGLHAFGGYEDAERKQLIYLPEYLDASYLTGEDAPVVCLRAGFYPQDQPTHRDFLGALIGSGIARQAIGDICIGESSCDFFVTDEIAPYLLQNFSSAGRCKLSLSQIQLCEVQIPQQKTVQIRDTLASLRLDSVISAGFRVGRSLAAGYVAAGKVSIDGLPCQKPDKSLTEGARISVRGLGKIILTAVNGQTKKGRISVVIDRCV